LSMRSNIALPKPKDWQDFERKTRVLFASVLADPNTQMHGRSGQPQHGMDIWGYRNEDRSKLVGVQCKKSDDEITTAELEAELEKAKRFAPPISEFILVTTAPRDARVQKRARELTEMLSRTDRPIFVAVWGWEDVEEHAASYPETRKVFDPTFDLYEKQAHQKMAARLGGLSDQLNAKKPLRTVPSLDSKPLDDAWKDNKTSIISLVAENGAGKSWLVKNWLDNFYDKHGAEMLLDWNFHVDGETATEGALDWALARLGLPAEAMSVTAKGEALAKEMGRRRVVLVLNGLDWKQHYQGKRQGALKDPGLRAFLRRFAAMPPNESGGLVVLTSHLPVTDIARWRESTAPVIEIRREVDDGRFRDIELTPPLSPLPGPSPATRFVYADGRFDVVPSSAWQNRGAQVSIYHARARELATSLALRLEKTDAVPDVAGSVEAVLEVLGEDVSELQPDQLRLASRSISAKARAYGHQAAHLEISVESVSALFELSDVLIALQAFARSDLEDHENAIRLLDLSPEAAAKAKDALDFVAEGVLCSNNIITERVEIAFAASTAVSDTAVDQQVKMAVEGDRILLTSNLALAIARELGRADAGKSAPSGAPTASELKLPKGRPTKRMKSRVVRAKQPSWDDFGERVLMRISNKGPDAIGDALIQTAVSTIRNAPKSVAGLGALFVLWPAIDPYILGGGAIASTIAWIGFQLRCRQSLEFHSNKSKGNSAGN
jgi:hypothetical protein